MPESTVPTPEPFPARSSRPVSRRTALSLGLAAAAAPLLAACGASTTGNAGSAAGGVTVLGTQFTVEEKAKFDAILKSKDAAAAYTAMAVGDFTTQFNTQVDAGKLSFGAAAGLHGDLAPLAAKLQNLDALRSELSSAGIPDELWTLAQAGAGSVKYIPWMQASYVLAVHKSALEHLPSGAKVESLTYDQLLDWATAGKEATGKAIFGFPAGAKGLYHRFFQGFLLPSFTGGQISTFASDEAIDAWAYMKKLWAVTNPASTNYDFMQEPLARGEVLVAWDHIARLIGAPKDKPEEWTMVPAPSGPKGLGYLQVVAGVGVPNGADVASATSVVKAMLDPDVQNQVLAQIGFLPVVKTTLPSDLPAASKMSYDAVQAQRSAPGAILSLPPVGLGTKDGEVSQVFKDCFAQICKDGGDPATVIPAQAKILQTLLDQAAVPCWAPDPVKAGETCKVG